MTDIYNALRRDVLDYGIVSGAYNDDAGFSGGLERLAAVVGDVDLATGEGTVGEPAQAHLTVHVFTAAHVATWDWKQAEGSTVLIRARHELLAIEIDDAPPEGRLAYTLAYPWGRVTLRERARNSAPREMLPSFMGDLGLS